MIDFLQAFWLGLTEGLTEFLPVSSTGHLIIVQRILGIKIDEFFSSYLIIIQFGTILSVFVLYWRDWIKAFRIYPVLFVAFIPAAVFGLLLAEYIDILLENVVVVAIMLLVGGVIFLYIDRLFPIKENSEQERGELDELYKISYKSAFIIGLFQCIAMIPGVSRSAATIIGGLHQKLSRGDAAKFSFFLAVPTMFAASAYKLMKSYDVILQPENLNILGFSILVSFITGLVAIKFFVSFISRKGFKLFGWYRIVLGTVLLGLLLFGVSLEM